MKFILILLMLIHSVIHSLGFRQSFNLISVSQFTQSISKFNGVLWLVAAVLFVIASLVLILLPGSWWAIVFPAVSLSQYLILTSWRDARFGTFVNIIFAVASLLSLRASVS